MLSPLLGADCTIFDPARGSAGLMEIRERHKSTGDLEVVVVEEPYKLNQNGCAVLRKTATYEPRFFEENAGRIVRQLASLLGRPA